MMIVLLFFSFVSFAQTPVLAPITVTTKTIQQKTEDSIVQQKVTTDEILGIQQLLNDIFYPGMKKAAIDNPELIRTNKHMDLIFYLFLLLVFE